jgi:hypothetical protein
MKMKDECGKPGKTPDESVRSGNFKWITNSLAPLPEGWVWEEDETAMLRSACFLRFAESIRTESLFAIAATGIRIYLTRALSASEAQGEVDEVLINFAASQEPLGAEFQKVLDDNLSELLARWSEQTQGEVDEEISKGNAALVEYWENKGVSFTDADLPSRHEWMVILKAIRTPPAEAWQPIETAPKDGTNILLWWPMQFHCALTGHWANKWNPWIGWKVSGWSHDMFKTEPTHWMPLPNPPAASKEDK